MDSFKTVTNNLVVVANCFPAIYQAIGAIKVVPLQA
jgi:hypothetical protein